VRVREVGCGDSGYSGEQLVDTDTEVLAHAGVRLTAQTAADCLAELRRRIRSPAAITHLLRDKHRPALAWLLGPSSPLFRRADVFLLDKTYFLLGKLADVLLADPAAPGLSTSARARALSDALFAERPGHDFLVTANNLLRGSDRRNVLGPVDAFFELATRLPGRSRAVDFRARLRADPALTVLDPLIPALVRSVGRWGADGTPIAIVHDAGRTLPTDRVRALLPPPATLGGARPALAGDEPAVQLAGILAGTVRTIAQDELLAVGDAELTTLVRPYLDPQSIWGDRRSWARLSA
jgi:hypothetical protein